MDNRQINQLKKLFNLLAKNNYLKTNAVTKHLETTSIVLLKLIEQLRLMGVKVSVENNYLHLKTKVDAIDENILKQLLLKLKLNTPLHCYFTTESTNVLAKNISGNGVFVSEHQTQGHGRREKKWHSLLGQSISVSISHEFNFTLQQLSGLNIAIAVAIMNTLKNKTSVGLKWPNDVVGKNGKIAGILIEATGNSKSCRAIIGVGINWIVDQSNLDEINQPTENLPNQGIDKTQFLANLILEISQTLNQFEKNKLNHILPQWDKYDIYKNKTINIISKDTTQIAKYLGVTPLGLLQAQINGETKLISNGEVSIRKVD